MSEQTAEPIYIIFDGPPSHESGRFVEVEDGRGNGLGPSNTGADWKQREDELWALGPFSNATASDDGYAAGIEDGASDGKAEAEATLLKSLEAIKLACPQMVHERSRLDAADWEKVADEMYDIAQKATQ